MSKNINSKVYDPTLYFSFNLLAHKTGNEIKALETRDNSTFYSFFLIFLGVFMFFLLTIVQIFIIEPRINLNNQNISNIEKEIKNYENIKRTNGELFIKSQILAPIIEIDIKVSDLILVAEAILDKNSNATITRFARESSGKFILSIKSSSYSSAISILKNAKADKNLINPIINDLRYTDTNEITFILTFELINK